MLQALKRPVYPHNCWFVHSSADLSAQRLVRARNCCHVAGSHSIPIHVIERMNQRFELPDPAKREWERGSLVLDATIPLATNMARVWEAVAAARASPLVPIDRLAAAALVAARADDRAATASSVLYQVDVRCVQRLWVYAWVCLWVCLWSCLC
jgi:hypothetical protein